MQLILTNTQGEMSPLEEGHHVAKYVERSAGGRGQKGGLREYARRLNRDVNALMQRQHAYWVYEKCIPSLQFPDSVGLKHLYEISKAPEEMWPPLAATMVAGKWTVKDTARAVSEVGKFTIPPEHAPWLPPSLVVESSCGTAGRHRAMLRVAAPLWRVRNGQRFTCATTVQPSAL